MSLDRHVSCRTLLWVAVTVIVVIGLALLALVGWFLPWRERLASEVTKEPIVDTTAANVPISLDPTPSPYWDRVFVEYILDASGSMLEDMDGERKIDIAKDVLEAKASQLPSTTNVGLRVYGHRVHYSDTEKSCQDIELLVPPVRGGRDRVVDKLPSLEAQGMTPLSEAVIQSVDDFDHKDPFRYNSLVVISDGEETCGGDPCTMTDDLVKVYGIHFTLYVVGFDILDNPVAQKQLRCLAEKTGGVYIEANNRDELARALDEMWNTLDQRAADDYRGQGPTPLTITPTNTPVPTPGQDTPQGEKIAFISNRDGNCEIYVMSADGSSLTNLTNHPANDGQPAWSPDGTHLAFVSDRDGNREIYVMRADGTGVTNLTNNPFDDRFDIWTKAWSPNSKQITFVSDRDGNQEIYVINADGSGTTNLTQDPGGDGNPAWSPDGKQIAFSSGRNQNPDIYIMNADGSQQANFTNNPANDQEFSWSPDGKYIAFESSRSPDPGYGIYLMYLANRNVVELIDFPLSQESDPAWSPDGSRIAFTSERDGSSDIFVMDSTGNDATNLTNGQIEGFLYTWSPDSTRIVFMSVDDDNNYEVYIMNADGSALTNLTNHPAYDGEPAWSP
jgi:Tol biopolymer transport system component